MSVTPDFVGQVYKDTATGNIWRANSTTPGDWTLEVQNMEIEWTPHSSRLSRLIGFEGFDGNVAPLLGVQEVDFNFPTTNQSILLPGDEGVNPSVLSIRFNGLTTITDNAGIQVTDFSIMTDLHVSDLISCSYAIFSRNDAITSLDLSSLITVSFNLECTQCDLLTTLNIGSLVTVAAKTLHTNPALTTILCSSLVPTNTKNFTAYGCALTDTTVNLILARHVANAAYVSGTINLSGGTSSAPTGQGILDKATLIGRGCTVLTN